jgi:hypothetical protein
MSSWFKGGSAKENSAKESKRYKNLESAQDKDPFGDVGFYSKGAPVTTSADDTNEAAQPKRSWKQRMPMILFVDQEGESPPPKTIGSGDLVGFPSDLDFCCLQDGAIDCLGAGTKIVLCEGEDDVEYTLKKNSQGKAQSNDNDDDDDMEKIRSICPVNSADTNETGYSQQLDSIREMGPIRDRKEGKGITYYLSQCAPEKSSYVTTSKKRLRIVLMTLALAVTALIAGIVLLTLRQQNKVSDLGGLQWHSYVSDCWHCWHTQTLLLCLLLTIMMLFFLLPTQLIAKKRNKPTDSYQEHPTGNRDQKSPDTDVFFRLGDRRIPPTPGPKMDRRRGPRGIFVGKRR